MYAMVTSGAPPHPTLSPSGGEGTKTPPPHPTLSPGGEGTAHGPLSLGRERAGVRVRRQFANYSGEPDLPFAAVLGHTTAHINAISVEACP